MNREQNVKTWLNEKKYLGAVRMKSNYSSVIASSEFFFKLASLFESLYERERRQKRDLENGGDYSECRVVESENVISRDLTARIDSIYLYLDSISTIGSRGYGNQTNGTKRAHLTNARSRFTLGFARVLGTAITERVKSSSVVKTSICHRWVFVVWKKTVTGYRLYFEKVGRLSPLPAIKTGPEKRKASLV